MSDRLSLERSLFDLGPDEPAPAASPDSLRSTKRGIERLIERLYAVRRQMRQDEGPFRPILENCIAELRDLKRQNDPQIEQRILLAIECSGAATPNEIADDLRLSIAFTNSKIDDMLTRGTLKLVRRFVPGSDRPQYLLKSTRQGTPEVCGEVFERPDRRNF